MHTSRGYGARVSTGARHFLIATMALAFLPPSLPTIAQPTTGPCSELLRRDPRGRRIDRADLVARPRPVDGDDLLAVVDRSPTGALPPDYAPSDLVDLATGRPARAHDCQPPGRQCLRREAAEAYRRLAAAMEAAGHDPIVTSAYRQYRTQCATFSRWRRRQGSCEAAASSALPGHSQHQLGTTLDLFSREWNRGGRFRRGFACDPAGRWIAEHAPAFGFVLPYPLHPAFQDPARPCTGEEDRVDPRTGYRFEPWHLRYVGAEGVARYHAEGGGRTLDEWLRGRDGAPPPVCDGCACDRCATFADEGDGPCGNPAWRLAADGSTPPAEARPRLLRVELERDGPRLRLSAHLHIPANTRTAPPVVTPEAGRFVRGRRRPELRFAGPAAYRAEGWRLAIGFDDGTSYPWRAALARSRRDGVVNLVDAPLPAPAGEDVTVVVPLDGVHPGTPVRVALTRGPRAEDAAREVAP
jgi:D-alanyl-D-alanine carboxypeptidase